MKKSVNKLNGQISGRRKATSGTRGRCMAWEDEIEVPAV